MKDEVKVLLFDVDGVIVDPLAYREAVNQTLTLLCRQCKFDNGAELLLTESEISRMESIGVHDVWDITNIAFAAILTGVAVQLAEQGIATDFNGRLNNLSVQQCLTEIGTCNTRATRPDYEKLITELSIAQPHGGESHPPDEARRVLFSRLEQAFANGSLDQWTRLLDLFLVGTRTPYKSYGTRLFQNIVLGKEDFTNTYELPSEYDGQSLLKTVDCPLISPDSVNVLKQMKEEASAHLAVYTARPSLACGRRETGYSPEAEIALSVAGINDSLPLVGMGAMDWLAKEHGERSEDLTKPNTTQAMAALIAALSGQCTDSVLEQAYRLTRAGETQVKDVSPTLAKLFDVNCTIFVFEDTVSGIKPMLALEERFRQLFSIRVCPLGIAKNADKRKSLASVCGPALFDDVNEALNSVLNPLSITPRS